MTDGGVGPTLVGLGECGGAQWRGGGLRAESVCRVALWDLVGI